MYSRGHAAVSAILGVALAALAPADVSPVLVFLVVVGLGVGIDFDHFLVARLNRGDWGNARRCLRDPRLVFLDQESIFGPDDVQPDERLLSHAIIGGVLVAALWPLALYWALVVGLTLYVHVVCDLYEDVRTGSSVPEDPDQSARGD